MIISIGVNLSPQDKCSDVPKELLLSTDSDTMSSIYYNSTAS